MWPTKVLRASEKRSVDGPPFSSSTKTGAIQGRIGLAIANCIIAEFHISMFEVNMSRCARPISRHGISILLVEQNARLALKLASRAHVLELGRINLKGNCEDLIDYEEVKRCYRGGT
jgi:hypothetical protein